MQPHGTHESIAWPLLKAHESILMIQDKQSQPVVATSASPLRFTPTTGPLRIWPAVVMLAAFWAFLYVNYNFELAMFARFISRMIAYGLLLLAFLGWWLTRRQIRWRDRLLAVGVVIVISLVAGLLSDASVGPLALFMTALPFVFTVWTLWLLFGRSFSPRAERLGFCAVMAATIGFFALLRWEGLYGNQIPQFAWRWSPTAEERFLATQSAEFATSSPNRPAMAPREWTLQPGDWPEFRGPNRNGVVRDVRFDSDWNTSPPTLLWRLPVGPAWSSMIVVDSFLVTQEQRSEHEAVVCYEAATGNEIWVHAEPERFFEALAGAGPRATPTFADGLIYAMGAKGRLTCLRASDGKLVWSRDVVKEAGGTPPQWGYSTSPLVVDGKVITFAGGDDQQSLVALDARSGEPVWKRPGGAYTYSSPQLLTIHGRRQILIDDNRALRSVNVDDGQVLWERASASEMAMPMLQPLLLTDGQLLLGADPGVVLLHVRNEADTWSAVERWATNRLKPSFNDFVTHNGYIYGLDDGILTCVDLNDGQRVWKRGRYGHGQMLLLAEQALLLILSERGEVVLVSASPDAHNELGRFQAIEGKTWNHPVLAHGRLYVRNSEELAAYELRQ
jgi:outer membrane protein assembly factor BamB